MHKLKLIFKKSTVVLLIALQLIAYPATTNATETTTATDPVDSQITESAELAPEAPSNEEVAPQALVAPVAPTTGPTEPVGPQSPTGPTQPVGPTNPTGVSKPTGHDSTTYHLNPSTGMYENDYYIWNPTTNQATLKTPQTYTYNPSTGAYDTTEWRYVPEHGRFDPVTVSVARPPSQSAQRAKNASIGNTGPSSNNQINFGGSANSTVDLYYGAAINNRLDSSAQSGNANILGNTVGGSALTGDAETIANVLNLLQSSWGSLGSSDIASFVANIDGDLTGDLFIDPNQLPVSNGNNNIDINIARNGSINNDIELSSSSGDATVDGNTSAGDATTGDARTVVNLLNLINSAIYANKSFVGVLNINGNLDGDILLPPGMLEAIIASTGPNSNNTISDDGNSNLDVSVDTNKSIINDVTADATTGNATLSGNTSAGNATSGSADNNITLLNLTGQRVVSKNALLVFVNVFGEWVGLIMNAPTGSYAVAATGPNSNNTIDSTHNTDAEINVTENSQINNNVKLAASSGDATVSGNTMAGNARSGNAVTGANVLNMIDSSFEISDWFGVLFINVFGKWVGSFGVNTAAGNVRTTNPSGGMGSGNAGTASNIPQVFGFASTDKTASSIKNTGTTSYGGFGGNNTPTSTLSTSTNQPSPPTKKDKPTVARVLPQIPEQPRGRINWWLFGSGMMAAVVLFGERLFIRLRSKAS